MIKTGVIVSAAALAVMAGAWLWVYNVLPADGARIPLHWGPSGAPDRFGSRDEALLMLLILPGAALFSAILLALVPALEPLKANLEKSKRAYLTAWIGIEILMALLTVGIALMTLRGVAGEIDSTWFVRLVIAGVGLLFVALGDSLPKTRANFFVGVRTPWTLTSDLSWEKTHRLMGRLFVLVGLWGVIAAFTLKGLPLALSISGPALIAALISIVYSYFIWRGDPDRRKTAGET